ncbi:glutaminyl-peptide cyclotransferase [Pedobacter sp. HMWF019]|uniref:glutaminyl-peptide cyclotransferase n=1 Tax=Pedobacter sp. HMWF019 TaxID=2056856 RepID=UPI001E517547|nr:glutaminyl-peptide cyclotransferase [Pedobacter sp. HMWF019]
MGVTFTFACKQDKGGASIGFKSPEQGKAVAQGEDVKIELDVPPGTQVTAATYLVDGKVLGSKNNAEAFTLHTKELPLGYRLVSAVVEHSGSKDTLTVNMELRSAVTPAEFGYKVVNTFPHDTTSYTQGLEYHDGKFLESTGEYGFSTLRWVDLQSGKALQKINLDKKYFGEGSSLVGDKVILLTWQENTGFVYDAKTFKQTGTFMYQNSREGWGLTFDGRRLLKSDGTNKIWFLNKDTYQEEGFIEVYDNKGQVDQLNELEYIDGKLYANIYQTDKIAIINPLTGVVERYIDLTGILSAKDRFSNTDVLNGIAWDAKGKRLFVTGKKFDKLFQITLVPKK